MRRISRSTTPPRWSSSSLTTRDVSAFESLLGGSKHVLQTDLDRFNCDWTQQFRGNAKLVLQPESTEQVAAVMRYCHERRISVVPQGGNTGLVGGGVPLANDDSVILSLSRMNRILSLDEDNRVIKLEAGVVLAQAEQHCNARGLTMPLDLGSKASCQIGGNLATNAGGIRFLRFGSLRANCLGLTAVLANGEVVDAMRALKKDNVGYDLKQLFIGSEGTLGVITRAAIEVHAKPHTSRVVVLGCKAFPECVRLLQLAKLVLGQSLSAFEYFDSNCLFGAPSPVNSSEANFYVLLECITLSGEEEEEALLMGKLDRLLQQCGGDVAQSAVMSQTDKQFQSLWGLRENITPKLRATPTTHVFKYDVSLPSAQFDDATTTVRLAVQRKHPKLKVFQYGHLGDGNLHFNATIDMKDSPHDEQQDAAVIQRDVEHELYGYVQRAHGSISAEHGLGQLKAAKMLKSRSPQELAVMRQIKHAMDPLGLLNPGKVLPPPEETVT